MECRFAPPQPNPVKPAIACHASRALLCRSRHACPILACRVRVRAMPRQASPDLSETNLAMTSLPCCCRTMPMPAPSNLALPCLPCPCLCRTLRCPVKPCPTQPCLPRPSLPFLDVRRRTMPAVTSRAMLCLASLRHACLAYTAAKALLLRRATRSIAANTGPSSCSVWYFLRTR